MVQQPALPVAPYAASGYPSGYPLPYPPGLPLQRQYTFVGGAEPMEEDDVEERLWPR